MNWKQVISLTLLGFIILFVLLIISYKYNGSLKKYYNDIENEIENEIENKSHHKNKKPHPFLGLVPNMMKESADELGLKYTTFNNRIIISDDNNSIQFKSYVNNINNNPTVASDKYLCSIKLLEHNIPVPQPVLFNGITESDISSIDNRLNIKFPLVVKPVYGTGGRNVFVGIQSFERMKRILNSLRNKGLLNILIEEHIYGKDYRILCYKNTVIDIVERIPPHVIGDGVSTIEELISIKNKSNSNLNLHSIKINFEYLNAMNIIITSIPISQQRVVVNPVSNYHNGGFPTRIPLANVHPDNLQMFSSINSILGLNLSGIDFLIPDISKSYKVIKGAVNEVNKYPNFDIHYNADNKQSTEISTKFLRTYFNL
jgi:D-alanine-D-alanine ligase-like ATP-grasp enzyme